MLMFDRVARIGMGFGIGLIFQPWLSWGLRVGFLMTLLFTVTHIITSHLLMPDGHELE